jgi:hypothetical protein
VLAQENNRNYDHSRSLSVRVQTGCDKFNNDLCPDTFSNHRRTEMNDTVDERTEMAERPKAKKKEKSTIEQRIEKFIEAKPSDKVKIVNVFDNNYRVNVYTFEVHKDLLFKRPRISASYFIVEEADGTLRIEGEGSRE